MEPTTVLSRRLSADYKYRADVRGFGFGVRISDLSLWSTDFVVEFFVFGRSLFGLRS